MAVVKNFWLRDNKQKLGGAVIYQANGQTLMRQLAPSVSNPRTDAQMETRVKLANLVAFYRASAGWMRGAFETKPANQSDYNAFVSANAAQNSVYLTKTQVESGNAVVAPYQVSRGSLGEVVQTSSANRITSNIYVGALDLNESTTIAQLSAALLQNNNGLLEGDQLSIIQYIQNTGTDGNYTITCRPYEMILSLSDTRPVGAYLSASILVVSSEVTPSLSIDTSGFVGGVAFILSRTQGGRIMVSSSVVTLTSSNSVYAAMTTTSQKNDAIRSYGTNTVVFLDSNLASVSNAEVATAVQLITITRGSSVYRPGSFMPEDYTEGDDYTFILSSNTRIPAGGKITFACPETNESVTLSVTEAGTGDTSVLNATIDTDADMAVPVNEEVEMIVTIPTISDGTITAKYIVSGGLG